PKRGSGRRRIPYLPRNRWRNVRSAPRIAGEMRKSHCRTRFAVSLQPESLPSVSAKRPYAPFHPETLGPSAPARRQMTTQRLGRELKEPAIGGLSRNIEPIVSTY